MQAKGLSQTSIADTLGVTRAAVSKWMRGQAFPRPAELLKLGKLFELGYSQLVVSATPSPSEPLIAFRRRAGTKTTPEYIANAKQMGRLLNPVSNLAAAGGFHLDKTWACRVPGLSVLAGE